MHFKTIYDSLNPFVFSVLHLFFNFFHVITYHNNFENMALINRFLWISLNACTTLDTELILIFYAITGVTYNMVWLSLQYSCYNIMHPSPFYRLNIKLNVHRISIHTPSAIFALFLWTLVFHYTYNVRSIYKRHSFGRFAFVKVCENNNSVGKYSRSVIFYAYQYWVWNIFYSNFSPFFFFFYRINVTIRF